MIFKCENCSHSLVNEFCPKCGQRMIVGCDECAGRIERIEQLETSLATTRKGRVEDAIKDRNHYDASLIKLRHEYDGTVEKQREELQERRAQALVDSKDRQQWVDHAWAKVAETLELKLPIGYVIDEAAVLRQLKIERHASVLLRAQVEGLKGENERELIEFARAREEFMAKLQDRNGALKLEAPKPESKKGRNLDR